MQQERYLHKERNNSCTWIKARGKKYSYLYESICQFWLVHAVQFRDLTAPHNYSSLHPLTAYEFLLQNWLLLISFDQMKHVAIKRKGQTFRGRKEYLHLEQVRGYTSLSLYIYIYGFYIKKWQLFYTQGCFSGFSHLFCTMWLNHESVCWPTPKLQVKLFGRRA